MMSERFELNEMELEEVIGGIGGDSSDLYRLIKRSANKIADAARDFSVEDFYQDYIICIKPVRPEDLNDTLFH